MCGFYATEESLRMAHRHLKKLFHSSYQFLNLKQYPRDILKQSFWEGRERREERVLKPWV